VLVVGDVMLDRYVSGSVTRISPESPVPVVQVEKEWAGVGGAANVAANVVALGVTLSDAWAPMMQDGSFESASAR
jgi:D-beta-D-heptose 7-phosphate kinase/D-beta-D-heptose 1-phosphate adenosyltransferase